MKKYFESLIASKEAKIEELRKAIDTASTPDEVRSLIKEADAVKLELTNAKAQLTALEANEGRKATANIKSVNADISKMVNVASADMATAKRSDDAGTDKRATMEYRKAFMSFVQSGEKSDMLDVEKRSSTGTSTDLGVMIPTTIIQNIITGVEKVYGQLYSRVTKTNIQGGVKYPIGNFTATFNRITEATGASSRQHAGEITGAVTFSYKIGEIRLARTLLQTVLSVDAFEQKFAEVIVKAYVEAMDKEIMTGTDANNQCVGILTEAAASDSRIPASNIIEFTASDMADWTAWQKKLFAEIPLGMRAEKPVFVMTANTYEANIKTLKDSNNRPVYNETFNPVDGAEICTFKGKEVILVEDDVLENFDDASNGEYFGMYWVPEKAYAINSNLEFSVVDYFDHETNQYIKKAIVINDGKVLDGSYIYLLKKKVTG